jgi:hypothetical protein
VRFGLRAGTVPEALRAFESLALADRMAARDPDLIYQVAEAVARQEEGGPTIRLLRVAAEGSTAALPNAALVLALGRRAPAEAATLLGRVERASDAVRILARLANDLAATGAEIGLVRRAAGSAVANDPADALAHASFAKALEQEGRAPEGAKSVAAFLTRTAPPAPPWEPRALPPGAVEDLLEPPARDAFARALAAAAPCLAAGWAERTARGTPLGLDDPGDEDSWLGRGSAVRGALLRAMSLVPGVLVQTLQLGGQSGDLLVEGGEPPRMLLGGAFGDLSDGAKLFAFVRGLLRIRFGEGVVPRDDPAEVVGWCRTLRRALVGASVDGVAGEGLARAAALLAHPKRIALSKVLDEGLRETTVESARATLDALRRGAARLALTMTGETHAALEALAGPHVKTAEARVEAIRNDADLIDLARFASGGGWI